MNCSWNPTSRQTQREEFHQLPEEGHMLQSCLQEQTYLILIYFLLPKHNARDTFIQQFINTLYHY